MSWSALAGFVHNKCNLCGEPLKDKGALLLVDCDVMIGSEAREFSKAEGWEPICSLLLGYDYLTENVFHTECIRDLVQDATAERIKELVK